MKKRCFETVSSADFNLEKEMLTKLNHYLVMTPKFTFLKTIVKEFQIGTLGMN